MSDEELQYFIPSRTVAAIATKRKKLKLIRSKKKYCFNDVKQAFDRLGYELLSNEYIDACADLLYICPTHKDKGILKTSFGHILEGKGCPYCGRIKAGKARLKDIDIEEDISLCKKNGFEYIKTERKGYNLFIYFICDKHRELGIQKMEQNNMKRTLSKGCKYCAGKDLPVEYVLKKAKEINPYIELKDSYKNLTTRMLCYCTKHNQNTYKTMQQILSGQGCNFCGREKLSILQTLSQKEFSNRIYEQNSDIEIIGEYTGLKNRIKIRCKRCGHIWNNSAASLLSNNTSCPVCTKGVYHGEKEIAILLEEWGYDFDRQFSFNDCKDKRPLLFDFALRDKENNVLCLIEFDGVQHFKPVPVCKMPQIHALDTHRKTVYHDEIKNHYCYKNNIPLVRIPYWEKDDLEYFLFDQLVKIGVIIENKSA